ncbi:unnamed protein product [Pedinophyceae sp. YPF-701]|nr:unnamed protein product [Pedinophyceae sp. YPF-701]
MRNIRVIRETATQLAFATGSADARNRVDHLVLDPERNAAYLASRGCALCGVSTDTGQELWEMFLPLEAEACEINLSTQTNDDLGGGPRVAGMAHSLELNALILAMSGGQILTLELDAGTLELTADLGAPILGMALSPVGDALVLACAYDELTLVLMSTQWVVLAEEPAQAFISGALSHKCLAPHGGGADDPGHEPCEISWREDGKYFASVTRGGLDGSQRRMRVWERTSTGGLALVSAGELEAGTLPPVAYCPNGRNVYCAAVDGDGAGHVLIYERNGLQHGGFTLPSHGTVTQLQWSPDSELLAVASRPRASDDDDDAPADSDGDDDAHVLVQIWRRQNWRWYLQYERQLPGRHVTIQWDPESPRFLHSCTSAGTLRRWEIATGTDVSPLGTAAVIDGRHARLTALGLSVVPPPMCSALVAFPRPLRQLSWAAGCEDETFAALMTCGGVCVAQSDEADLWEDTALEGLATGASGETEGAGEFDPGAALKARDLVVDGLPALQDVDVTHIGWAAPGVLVVASFGAPAAQPASCAASGADTDVDEAVEGRLRAIKLEMPPALSPDSTVHGTLIGQSVTAGSILTITCVRGLGAVVQHVDGSLSVVDPSGAARALPPELHMGQPCPDVIACPEVGSGDARDHWAVASLPPLLGVTPGGALLWGGATVAEGVLSVGVRAWGAGGAFLLFTTRTGLMHVLPVRELAEELVARRAASNGALGNLARDAQAAPGWQAPAPRADKGDGMHLAMQAAMRPNAANAAVKSTRVRIVEDGSHIIAAPPGGSLVVLQAPRGNLEGVCPRVLVLAAVSVALDAGNYREAFRVAAANRVDLNLLVDYRWPRILEPDVARAAVESILAPSHLMDLVGTLQEGSTVSSGGVYDDMVWPAGEHADPGVGGAQTGAKVPAVCGALRAAMAAVDRAGYTLAVLSTHIREGDPAGALRVLRTLRESEGAREAQPGPTGQLAPSAEDALRHLLVISDGASLYTAALSMYDVQLAFMVASSPASGMDPAEVLEELQALADEPVEALRRYRIDLKLKRWSEALRNLAAAGDAFFGDALALAAERGLLRECLLLYDKQPEFERRVLAAMGASLQRQNRPEDAGLAFVAGGDARGALEAYLQAGDWEMAMTLAGRLGMGPAERAQLARSASDALVFVGRLREAGILVAEYMGNIDEGVSLMTQAREWRYAARLCYKHARPDLEETIVAPAAADAAAQLLEHSSSCISKLRKYHARVVEVREKRRALAEAEAAAAQDEDNAPPVLDHEVASDAGSIASAYTAYTTGTAVTGATRTTGQASSSVAAPSTVGGRAGKKSRKGKKARGIRAGAANEEKRLLEHLESLGPTELGLKEAGALAELLVSLGHLADARVLQREVGRWLEEHVAVQREILSHGPRQTGPAEEQLGAEALAAEKEKAADAWARQKVALDKLVAVGWKWEVARGA